jgi:hypothetical protein
MSTRETQYFWRLLLSGMWLLVVWCMSIYCTFWKNLEFFFKKEKYPEDGDSRYLWNIGAYLRYYNALNSRWRYLHTHRRENLKSHLLSYDLLGEKKRNNWSTITVYFLEHNLNSLCYIQVCAFDDLYWTVYCISLLQCFITYLKNYKIFYSVAMFLSSFSYNIWR